jgi:carboxyl-terminal processing protease
VSILQHEKEANPWIGSVEQKIWILMRVWAEVRFNFAFFDQVPGLDWDQEVKNSIPRILASEDKACFYAILQELVAKLDDGHTFVMPPLEEMESLDHPAVELEMIDNKIIVTRVGNNSENERYGIRPGLRVTQVNGVDAIEYLEDKFVRYYSGGTKHWGYAYGLSRLLDGPKNSVVELRLRSLDDGMMDVELSRDSELSDGTSFKARIFDYDPLVENRIIDDVAYFRLSTFIFEEIVEEFGEKLGQIDSGSIRGMILDVRYNTGGNSDNAFKLLSLLIDEPVETARWRTRKYLPAYRSWGEPEEWHEEGSGLIQPAEGKRYSGPLVVLAGHHTASAAEDFLVPLKYSKRAKIIGDVTAGSTGNPVTVQLPGGYFLRVCSKHDSFPDGEEFVGIGIQPDTLIKNTQKDFAESRDVVLLKAFEVIQDWENEV